MELIDTKRVMVSTKTIIGLLKFEMVYCINGI